MQGAFILGLLGNLGIAVGIIALVFVANYIRKKTMRQMDNLVAFTVGLIIAIIFLGFLPEIVSEGRVAPKLAGELFLLGIFLFYIFELFLHWHHCKDIGEHHHEHHTHEHKNNALMFAGTFLHNFLHGVVLFSAFSINPYFGLSTTLAVFLHAIPQNIANLLMNHKDARYAYIAAFGGVIGALAMYPFQTLIFEYNMSILAVIAGGLLYTAMSDILPSFKEKGGLKHKFLYLIFMLLGVLAFVASNSLTGHDDHGHEGENHTEIIDMHEAEIH